MFPAIQRAMESWDCTRYAKCIFCWDCCFLVSEVRAEIIGHLAMLMAMTISFIVLMHPGLEPALVRLPCCRNGTDGVEDACETSASAVVILRFSLIYVFFFLGSFSFDLTTKRFEGRGRYIASNFWFLKFLAVGLGCFAAVYIRPKYFDKIWTIFLGMGSVIFIVAQVYTVVRLSYVIIITLHKLEEKGSKSAYKIQLALFVSGIIFAVFGEAMLIYYYPLCSFNVVFLVTNALIPAVACLWSVSNCVKARNGYSGFVQGSILTCFVVFYTWSAFTNEPSLECNPYFKSDKPYLSLYHVIEVILVFFIYIINTNFTYILYIDELEDSRQEDLGRSSSAMVDSSREYKVQIYNSAWCSFLRCPMICFIVMSCTDWSPESLGNDENKTSTHAVWFKLVGCWLSIIFFIITLYVPSVYGVTRRKKLLD